MRLVIKLRFFELTTRSFYILCALVGVLAAFALHLLPMVPAIGTLTLTGAPGGSSQTRTDATTEPASTGTNSRVQPAEGVAPPSFISATALEPPAQQTPTPYPTSKDAHNLSLAPREHSYANGIRRAGPAVVSIYTSETIYRSNNNNTENSIAPNERRQTNQGSGVIFDRNGHILTSYHLIDQVDEIFVALSDGRLFNARLIGSDSETDLAVVRVESETQLPWCDLNNDATLEVGDIVLAIGNPFGVGQTATQGIVSALRRRISGVSLLQNFVQIDAAINPGNSGGALINPMGDLVGINTAVFSRENGAQGIGFAIPSEVIREVVPQIIEYGRVIRGWLGVGVEDLNSHPSLYRLTKNGAVVAGMFASSPAANSGLRRGDVIVSINGQDIVSAGQLLTIIAGMAPGTEVELVILRTEGTENLRIELAERPLFENR